MGLLEQLAALRALGINESDSTLQRLLSMNSFSTDAAANKYFESGAPPSQQRSTQLNLLGNAMPTQGRATILKKITMPVVRKAALSAIMNLSPAPQSQSQSQGHASRGDEENPILLDDNSQEEPGHASGGGSGSGSSFDGLAVKLGAAKPKPRGSASASASSSASRTNESCPSTGMNYFVGRRTCYAYTLSSGYAQRSQGLELLIEDGGYQKAPRGGARAAPKGAAAAAAAAAKRDKYAGAKLIVEASTSSSHQGAAGQDAGAFRSRLPNTVCDFLVPLLQARLIAVRGHVAYDLGAITLMQDVPVSLQVFISEMFLDLTEAGTLANRTLSHLIDAANDLLLWLHEGESAVVAVRKQRQADADLRDKQKEVAVASVMSANTADAAAEKGKSSSRATGLDTAGSGETEDPAATVDPAEQESEQEPEVLEEFSKLVNSAGSAGGTLYVLPAAQQPAMLIPTLTMRKYQLQALHWMRQRESLGATSTGASVAKFLFTPSGVDVPHDGLLRLKEQAIGSGPHMHSTACAGDGEAQRGSTSVDAAINLSAEDDGVWLSVPAVHWDLGWRWTAQETPDRVAEQLQEQLSRNQPCRFYWNMYSQRISRVAPPPHYQAPGGILADDMGLGKTVMAAGLIAADYALQQVLVPTPPTRTPAPAPAKASRKEVTKSSRKTSHARLQHIEDIEGGSDTDESESELRDTSSEEEEEENFVLRHHGGRRERPPARSARAFVTLPQSKKRRKNNLVVSDMDEQDEEQMVVEKEGAFAVATAADDVPAVHVPNYRSVWTFSSPSRALSAASTSGFSTAASALEGKTAAAAGGSSCVSHATLIVCPMTLMSQWAEELTTKMQNKALRVIVYYGAQKEGASATMSTSTASDGSTGTGYTVSRDAKRLKHADVVVTSYGVLVSDCRAWLAQQEASQAAVVGVSSAAGGVAAVAAASVVSRKPGLLRHHWHRVILDEAHVIKNHHTETARACCTLQSQHRWCLTGTPLQNTIDDVYSLVRFLGHEPWCEHRFWRKVITDPYKAQDPQGMHRLHLLLSDLLLRRTKNSKDSDGNSIVNLPPRTVHVVPVLFEEEERAFYQAIVDRSKSVFHRFEGTNVTLDRTPSGTGSSFTVDGLTSISSSSSSSDSSLVPAAAFAPFLLKNKYAALFTLLMRMRQACDHPMLVFGKGAGGAALSADHRTSGGARESGDAADEDESTADAAASRLLGPAFLDGLFKRMQNARKDRLSSTPSKAVPIALPTDTATDAATNILEKSSSLHVAIAGDGTEMYPRDAYMSSLMERLHGMADGETFECPICMDDVSVEDGATTRCGHLLCVVCAKKLWPAASLTGSTATAATAKPSLRLSAHPASLKTTIKVATAKCPLCSDVVPADAVFSLAPMHAHVAQQRKAKELAAAAAAAAAKETTTDAELELGMQVGQTQKGIIPSGPWRSWGDARLGLGPHSTSKPGAETYVSSSKLEAVVRMLQFVLDTRREHVAWDGPQATATATAKLVCARCGVQDKDSRPSVASRSPDGNNSHLDPIFTSACTYRCSQCRDCRYCDDCFARHECVDATEDEDRPLCIPTTTSTGTASAKVVVFSQWTTMLDILEPVLSAHNLAFVRLDGKMSQAQRAKSVTALNTDPAVRILLASLKAGGVGLNLVSANHVILIDPWWNPSTEDQAIDRVHRLGQTRPVHVFRFVCADSVEERLLQLQKKKRNMSTHALSGGGGGEKRDASKLSMEELRAFFL